MSSLVMVNEHSPPCWPLRALGMLILLVAALSLAPIAQATVPVQGADAYKVQTAVEPKVEPKAEAKTYAYAAQTQAMSNAVARTLSNILSYVRWPDKRKYVRLCVIGQTEFAETLLGPYVRDKNARIKTGVRRSIDDPNLIAECDVVYMGALTQDEHVKLANTFANQPVLTLLEESADCAMGAMFCLTVTPLRVGFRINLDAVARSSIKIHPNLLRLARTPEVQP